MRSAVCSALCLALACGPAKQQGTGSEASASDATSIAGSTMNGTDTSATTAAPTGGTTLDEPNALCVADPEVLARFGFDLDDWPLNEDGAWRIDAPCLVDAIIPSSEIPVLLMLQCTDPMGVSRAVELNTAKYPVARLPVLQGQALTLHLRTSPALGPSRGAWALRDVEGELLLAGNRADAPVPGEPDFFMPFTISVDAGPCPAGAVDGCTDAQRLVLEFRIGEEAVRVGHGQHGVLPGGFDLIVERALEVTGDPAPCSDEYRGPEALQFSIVGR